MMAHYCSSQITFLCVLRSVQHIHCQNVVNKIFTVSRVCEAMARISLLLSC